MNNNIIPTDGSDFEVVPDIEATLNRLTNEWTAGKLNVDLKLFLGYTSQTCLSTS